MYTDILAKLQEIVNERKLNPKEGSYTNSLLTAGENKIIKKIGEESAEFILSFLKETDDRLASEAADIIYHLIVALNYRNISLEAVCKELEIRFNK